jgi:AraC family transcriptional regulator
MPERHPSAPATLLTASDGLGWRGLTLRRYADDPRTAAFESASRDVLSVVLVRSGSYVIESSGERGRRSAHYRPGSIGITAPGHVDRLSWTSTSPDPMRSLHLSLDLDLVASEAKAVGVDRPLALLDRLHLVDDAMTGFMAALEVSMVRRTPTSHAEGIARSLIGHLMLAVDEERPPVATTGGLAEEVLGAVLARIGEGLDEPLTIDVLARLAYLSRYHFLRQFQRSVGVTPHRFIVTMRLHHAASLLRETRLPIATVMARSGWRSRAQFAAAFRAQHGVTPSVYRGSDG